MKRFVLGALAVMTMTAAAAFAKMVEMSDEECVKQSPVILIGKVKDVLSREKFPPDYEFTIEVSKTLKGKADATIKLQMPGIADNTPPKAGDEKIFLLKPEGDKADNFKMAIGSTVYSVRDVKETETIEKLIAAEKKEK